MKTKQDNETEAVADEGSCVCLGTEEQANEGMGVKFVAMQQKDRGRFA